MIPSQLDLLPAGLSAEQLRKRAFWKRTMSISLTIGVILTLLAMSGTVINMIRAFDILEKTGSADPAELTGVISAVLLITIWSLPPA